jgi:hypothetical protein
LRGVMGDPAGDMGFQTVAVTMRGGVPG